MGVCKDCGRLKLSVEEEIEESLKVRADGYWDTILEIRGHKCRPRMSPEDER